MKTTVLAIILSIFCSRLALAQAEVASAASPGAPASNVEYYEGKKDKSLVGTAAGAGRAISIKPKVTAADGAPNANANAYVANNLFKVNYRTLKRGQDHDLTLKNGTRTGLAKWNAENGTYTVYDNEMNLLGTVVYGKSGRYQIWSEENVMLKDSGNRVEKVLSYIVLIGIGIGVTAVATTGV